MNADKESLKSLTKEELIEEVSRLQAYNKQLKNLLNKQLNGSHVSDEDGNTRKKPKRDFDFRKYNTRHVLLKILYLGWDYDGLAVQEDTVRTIEFALFKALHQTKLVESRSTSNYHRCGRTDKGVSAFCQVISIDLRSNLLCGDGVKVRSNGTAHERKGDTTTELSYVHMLNKVLPSDIRVIAWTPVRDDFSARFDCKQRTYRYFFPKGTLNIEKMRIASSYLIGQYDFRNLCKMDVANGVVNFVRNISDVRLAPFSSNQRLPSPIKKSSSSTTTMEDNSTTTTTTTTDQTDQSYDMYVLTIVSQAFLWHQIRCIMAVLLLVGEEAEKPEIVKDLLDVSTYPNKPQYSMASEIPLVLYECEYDDITWIMDEVNMRETVSTLQSKWSEMSIKSTMLRAMLEDLSSIANACVTSQSNMLLPGNKPKVYKPLLSRPTCESLEDRINYHNRKRKLKTLCESD